MAEVRRQKSSVKPPSFKPRSKLGSNQILSKSSSGDSNSLNPGSEKSSSNVSSALSILDKLDLNNLKQTTYKYVNKSAKLQQQIQQQQQQLQQDAADAAARRACIDYALELVISNLIINGQLDPNKAYQMRTPVMKARIGLLCEKILRKRKSKQERAEEKKNSSKKVAPPISPAPASDVPLHSSKTTDAPTPVTENKPTSSTVTTTKRTKSRSKASDHVQTQQQKKRLAQPRPLPLAAITDSTLAHMQGLGLDLGSTGTGASVKRGNERIPEKVGKKSGVLHFKAQESSSSISIEDLRKLKEKKSKTSSGSVILTEGKSNSKQEQQKSRPKQKRKSKTSANVNKKVEIEPSSLSAAAATSGTCAVITEPKPSTSTVVDLIVEEKQVIYQTQEQAASSEVPSNFSIDQNHETLTSNYSIPSSTTATIAGDVNTTSVKMPRSVQFEVQQEEPTCIEKTTPLLPTIVSSNTSASTDGICLVGTPVAVEEEDKVKPVSLIESPAEIVPIQPSSAVMDSCPSTAKTLNSIITAAESNTSIATNPGGFHILVDMKGFLNEEIAMEVEGRQLIFVASRPKKNDRNMRKVTEIIEVPGTVNMENLKIGRRQDGFVVIEEHE